MKTRYYFILTGILIMCSCSGIPSAGTPGPPPEDGGGFYTASSGNLIYSYEYLPSGTACATVYVLSGITGINHNSEMDIIRLLSGGIYRVVVIHPTGTGYSEGPRGSLTDFDVFLDDYTEALAADLEKQKPGHSTFFYGHSMSCAVAMLLAQRLPQVSGVILVNPPLKMKESKGMTPSFIEYIKYAAYMIFAPHRPVVNMAGDPSLIENPEERREAVERAEDPLLVKYFSMYMMLQSKKMMDSMADRAGYIDLPLLLVYGNADSIVEKSGCLEIFNRWKCPDKTFLTVPGGPHGKMTVIMAETALADWLQSRIYGEKG